MAYWYDDFFEQYPVLRPFVNIYIKSRKGGVIAIDDVQDPYTNKFRHLRSFSFLLSGSNNVEITLFDEVGHLRNLLSTMYTIAEKKKMQAASPDLGSIGEISFRWGWSTFSPSLSYGLPGGTGEVLVASGWHSALLSGLEVSYEDGGFSYRITATDPLTILQGNLSKHIYKNYDIRQAIKDLLEEQRHKPLGIKVEFDENGNGPALTFKDWECNGRNPLMCIRLWLAMCRAENGRPLMPCWDSKKNVLFVTSIPPNTTVDPVQYIYGPHDVNNYIHGKSATKVINFSPQVNGLAVFSAIGQIGVAFPDERIHMETLTNNESPIKGSFGQQGELGRGNSQHMGTERIDQLEQEQVAKNLENTMAHGERNSQSQNFSATAQLSMFGWPFIEDPFQVLTKSIFLNVYNPFGLNAGEMLGGPLINQIPTAQWSVAPGRSSRRDDLLSGNWKITKLTHVIDETGYKMNLDINRPDNPDNIAPLCQDQF